MFKPGHELLFEVLGFGFGGGEDFVSLRVWAIQG